MQSDIAALAIKQFRTDWPFMASLLDSMREKEAAAAERRQLADARAAGVPAFVTPTSNTGVNECQPKARGLK